MSQNQNYGRHHNNSRPTQGSRLYSNQSHQGGSNYSNNNNNNNHNNSINNNNRHTNGNNNIYNNHSNASHQAPRLNSFSFQKQIPVSSPSSGTNLYSNVGSGGIRFDLNRHQQQQNNNYNNSNNNTNTGRNNNTSNAYNSTAKSGTKDWRNSEIVNKNQDAEKLAKRAERFGTNTTEAAAAAAPLIPPPALKRELYKPEQGYLSKKKKKTTTTTTNNTDSAENGSDFIGLDNGDDEDDDDDSEDEFKIHKKFNDRDPLDLVYDLPSPVWADSERRYSSNLTEMFNQEVQDYVQYVSPTPSEHSLRHLTIERLRFVVSRLWPSATLYLPTSDVDVVIMGNNLRAPASLFELSVALRNHKYVSKIEVIAKARVPIIKYTDALTSFPVDISINMASGLQAAEIVSHFLNEPNGIGEAIRGLMYLLKQFLLARHLNEPFNGGCGSYALLILVSTFVKLHPLFQIGAINPSENLGTLFLEFLELYGRHFNYPEVGIMCDLKTGPEYFLKRDLRGSTNRKIGYLTVLDPQDDTNDVGAGAFNFFTIKQEFFRASQRIMCILGAGQKRFMEHERQRKKQHRKRNSNHAPKPPLSILSAILTVRKGLFSYRCDMEDLWEKVSAGQVATGVDESSLKRHEEERQVAVKRKREEGEISDERLLAPKALSNVVDGAVDSPEAEEPQRKKARTESKDFVPFRQREEEEWASWEKQYFQTLREAKEELGYSGSDVSMELSSGEEEEGTDCRDYQQSTKDARRRAEG
ncbi:hypothetical protein BDR26DRAFT_866285 [Obelidium mucronatum]|nr:hypothetical protein BDR26DRAFT_866285 [Obelidium mucronatum]